MQGFLRHSPEENALRKTLLMVYSFSVGCYLISGSFLLTMGFLKPESDKVHRIIYCMLGFGSIGLCGVGAIAAKTTEKDALDLATNDYLRSNDQKKDLARRAYFDETEREMRFEQAKQQMQMAVNGNFNQIYGALQANIEQQQNQQKLIVNLAKQVQQLKQGNPVKSQVANHRPVEDLDQLSVRDSEENYSTEISNILPPNNRRSLPEVIASNRITQLFFAGTRVGKTALVKACIFKKLEREPNTLFFISACKRNDWFGLEDVQSQEFGYHHSISNGSDIQGIINQVNNAFSIYNYRANNLTEDEQKASSPVILILDDWTAQMKNLSTKRDSKNDVVSKLVSIANNGAGCNVTVWVTGQSANVDTYGFLDAATRRTMNFAALGRIVVDENGRLEGGYDAIETTVSNTNRIFTPDKAAQLSEEYNVWRGRRDRDNNYSISPLALLSIGAETWFEELEDYTPIIQAAKKNKPVSSTGQKILKNMEKTPVDDNQNKFWGYVAKLEGQILEKAVEKGLTPSDVLNNCSAAVQIRKDEAIKNRISKDFIEGMFRRLAQEGKGRIEESDHQGKPVIRFFSS
ncbi:MAG: hypothetical protein AAFO04_19350 [Cyanobacteria bacterium J06592_8]